MAPIALTGATVCTGDAVLPGHAVLLEGRHVAAVVPEADVPGSAERVTCDGAFVAPGLVDLQVNGGGGVLLDDDPTPAGLARIVAAREQADALLGAARGEAAALVAAAHEAAAELRERGRLEAEAAAILAAAREEAARIAAEAAREAEVARAEAHAQATDLRARLRAEAEADFAAYEARRRREADRLVEAARRERYG